MGNVDVSVGLLVLDAYIIAKKRARFLSGGVESCSGELQ